MHFKTEYIKIISSQINVCNCLRKVADTLDVNKRHWKGGKIASGCGGIVASALAIAGIALSPVTFGASLGLTISGAVLGASSAAGGIGAAVADKQCTKTAVQEAETAFKDFNKDIEDILKDLKDTGDYQVWITSFQGIYGAGSTGLGVATAVTASSTTATIGKAASVAGIGLRVMRIGGIVFCALTIPLDIGIIVSNSVDIHKKTPSQTAEDIRKLADAIEAKPLFEAKDEGKKKCDNILMSETTDTNTPESENIEMDIIYSRNTGSNDGEEQSPVIT